MLGPTGARPGQVLPPRDVVASVRRPQHIDVAVAVYVGGMNRVSAVEEPVDGMLVRERNLDTRRRLRARGQPQKPGQAQ